MHCKAAVAVLFLSLFAAAPAQSVNPVSKVVELLTSLEAKITSEGAAAEKAYEEYEDWCRNSKQETGFAIETATKEIAEFKAAIAKATSDGQAADEEIGELTGAIAKAEGELQSATTVREKERADFEAAEAELLDTVNTLDRAITIIEREMSKSPALLQKRLDTSNMQNLLNTLNTIIDAASLTGSDRNKLVALVQASQSDSDEDSDDDEALGAPAAAVYKNKSGGIVDVLNDMKDKAEDQLSDVRKSESKEQHNYAMLKQSLEDQMKFDNKELADAKNAKAAAAEAKATAEADLATSTKELAVAKSTLETLNSSCADAAANHESSQKGREQELKALAEAKAIISEKTGAAESRQYSLLQTSSKSHAELVKAQVVSFVKKLAKEHHSSVLAQLASRISALLQYGSNGGEDPFGKVIELITSLIDKLEKEAAAEAKQKAYCDEEMAKTAEKKADLQEDIAKLSTKIDSSAARSAKLKEEVATLEKELAALVKLQAEMDQIRQDENAAFKQAKADLEEGISGIQGALKVLRDYYAKSEESGSFLQDPLELAPAPELAPAFKKAEGAGGSIISILELIESDFSKSLAEETVQEEEAQATYEKVTQENKITKATNEQDTKYKSQESTALDKSIAEMSSDKDNLQTELSAVLEYDEKLNSMCVAKPETYEERSKRRQAEIAGLKEALNILGGESFVQRGSRSILRHA